MAADLGCGIGPLLPWLAGHFGHVHAVDFAEGMLSRARERCAGLANVTFHQRRLNDAQHEFPLVVGGDHSIALGSISGVARVHRNIGVIWIDAHADFNTEETTPSGNVHGMILAALAGIGHRDLANVCGWSPKIHAETIVIVGARDIDPSERERLHANAIHVFTMSDIDQRSISVVMRDALTIAGLHKDGIHLSLDMDALDPKEAPGVGTPVRGGLTYREAHLAMEMIADAGNLVSMDVVEVNPILDRENATASLAVELVLSALGKKIF